MFVSHVLIDSPQRGLNSRPLVYKTNALPLSYKGMFIEKRAHPRIELGTSCTQSKNHTIRPASQSASSGNRTRGYCLEGNNVTTTPPGQKKGC